MLKSDLVSMLVNKRGLPQKQAERAVEQIFDAMKDELQAGHMIELRGFGTFRVKWNAAYIGQNPKTQAPIPVPAKRAVVFRTGKDLHERVNKRPLDRPTTASTSDADAEENAA